MPADIKALAELRAELLQAADEEREHAVEQDFWHEEILRKAAAAIPVPGVSEAMDALKRCASFADWHEKIHSIDCDDGRQVLVPMQVLRLARAALTSLTESPNGQ